MSEESFSKRYGYGREPTDLIYEDAPEQIRQGLKEVLGQCGCVGPHEQRAVICKALRVRPNPDNWSPGPVDQEVDYLLHKLEWYEFYNLCEKLDRLVERVEDWDTGRSVFEISLNKLFEEEHIGYRMEWGKVEKVGSEEFAQAEYDAREQLRESKFKIPLKQFEKALGFRNGMPPDYPNAVKEAVNAIEGVCQVIAGEPGVSLPTLLSGLHPPLPSGLKKLYDGLYGYGSGSEGARHSNVGGHVSTGEEAEFILHAAAGAIVYLIKKYG